VVTVHDARPHHGDRPSAKTPQWTANRAFVAADHLIAHSHAVRDELVGPLGFQPDRVSVVPLGAAEIGVPVAPRPGGPPTVLFFGRIWPYKGLEYLAAAEAAVSAAVPDVRFIVAGDGEPWSAYERFAAHPERFDVRAGRVPDLEVPALFAEATVVVLPYADATQSGVATLAYRFGRPVVATSVRGLAEQVRDGVTGLLVPPRDPAALASALVRVLTDAELARRIAEGGRQLARDDLSPTAVAEQTLEVYRRVVDRSRAGR
jgi:glycosyltransferase involved in cell wall biosynthesis